MSKILLEEAGILLDADKPEYRLKLPEVMDISEEEELQLEIELLEEGKIELEVTLYPLFIARPEFFPSVKGSVAVSGKGFHRVDIPYEQLEFRQMVRAFFNYIDAVSFQIAGTKENTESTGNNKMTKGQVLLKSARAEKIGDFEICAEQSSKSGSTGEWISYSVLLRNKTRNNRIINIRQNKYGMECLPVDYRRDVELAGDETKEYEIKIKMTEDIPAGGAEKSEFIFIPDGMATQMKRLSLYACKAKNHPYLSLKEEQWEKRKSAIYADAGLYEAFQKEYEEVAIRWKVPEISESVEFVYPSYSQNDLFRTAVAWKITGKEGYRQKALKFLDGLLDVDYGYLKTRTSYFAFIEDKAEYTRGDFKVCRAQNAGWVQEAEFFNKVSMSYDLLYEYFTPDKHQKMEACLKNYMKFAGWRLTDGDGNNFQIAEGGAGLLCAMVLQDYGMIGRFLYGYNGYTDLLSSVFLDDGMYFEEATGYVRLAGELYFDIVNAAENFGISLKGIRTPASFDRNILHSPWAMRETWAEDKKPFLGMSFRRFERFTKPDRSLKEYFDCIAKLLTDRGILFSMNDSNEQDFTRLYQKAYYLYGDPSYKKIAELSQMPEVLFAREEEQHELRGGSVLLEAAGLGVLREKGSQAVLKFGSHGGYHGHFDRLSLASFLKDGKTFHNNEYAWFGYDSFLFKMWVQSSVAHNMVVVDGRMQKPSPCQCIYYEDNDLFHAVCAQTTAEWIDPPYGGQTPYPYEFPEEKCAMEGRHILPPGRKRKQGEIGEYSEPVFIRRLLILFHGYCIVWDYLEGKESHRFDCLYHPMGRFENEDGIDFAYKERFFDDPFGAGQFILNCNTAWIDNAACSGGSLCFRFHDAMSRVNGNDIIDFMPESAVWRAYPLSGDAVIGKYPEKRDTFTEGNRKESMGYLAEPLKKTVSFTVEGKTAGFITLLEAGEETGQIRSVKCQKFDSITIEERNGGKWLVSVAGMEKAEAGVSVKISMVNP